MKKNWKIWLPALGGIACLCGYSMLQPKGIAVSHMDGLTQHAPQVVAQVMTDANRTGQLLPGQIEDISVEYGDLEGTGNQDAIVQIQLDPQNTVLEAYRLDRNIYEYIGEIGAFYQINDINFVPLEGLDRNLVVVEEYADNRIGAFEENTYLRGYIFEDGRFAPVLGVPEDIKASWNPRWALPGNVPADAETGWERITQTSESRWIGGEEPALEMIRHQQYFVSEEDDPNVMPEDDNFQMIRERIITERYVWSDKYGRFILGEKRNRLTGTLVAVLEDFATQPYELTNNAFQASRVQYEDGTQEVVYNSDLVDV